MFEKFYAQFSNTDNCSYNLGRSINKEKQIKKIIANIPYWFDAKVTMIESMYKPNELTTNELDGDLQVFELHHLLPR